jgi:hypothetical protein
VLNGTSTSGLGAKAADDLAALGFSVTGRPANAPAAVGADTVVRYDPRFDQSARTVAAAIPGSRLTAAAGIGRTIEVTVGSSYAGAQKVAVASASPTTAVAPRTAAQDVCG